MNEIHNVPMTAKERNRHPSLVLEWWCMFFGLFAFFIVICLVFRTDVYGANIETEDEELLESFEAARESWIQNVSFYANYTFKRKVFYSEEEARTQSIADKYTVATGIICKLKDKYRMQAFYVDTPKIVNKSGAVSGRSIDTIANKNFHAHFYPEQGTDFLAEGSLNKRSTYTISNVVSHLDTFYTPFALFLRPLADISKSVVRDPKYTIEHLGQGRELLSFTGKNTSGHVYVKKVTVRASEKIPVIEQMTLHRFGNEGSDKPLHSGTIEVLEWKICDGISVPRIIRTLAGPLKTTTGKTTWVVSEWRSDDLGKRPPTDKDFLLQLPPDVGLVGMNHYPKGGLVDIDTITDDDFLPMNGNTYYGQETWEPIEPDTTRYFALRWTFMVIGIALIVWGLIQAHRRKK